MLTVTIIVCSWCDSPRPIRVDGVEKIKPGLHPAYVQLSHGMCATCEVKFSEEMQKGGVSQPDTDKPYRSDEEKKGNS